MPTHTHTTHTHTRLSDSDTATLGVRCALRQLPAHSTAHTAHAVVVEDVLQPVRVAEVEARVVPFLITDADEFAHRLASNCPPVALSRAARLHKVRRGVVHRLFPNIFTQLLPVRFNLGALYVRPLQKLLQCTQFTFCRFLTHTHTKLDYHSAQKQNKVCV